MQVKLKMPNLAKPLKDMLRSQAPVAFIETAPLKSTRRAVMAWFIQQAWTAPPESHFVWCSPSPYQAKREILDILKGSALGKSLIEGKSRDFPDIVGPGRSMLWYQVSARLPEVSGATTYGFVVENAHSVKDDPQIWMAMNVIGPIRMFGQPGEEGHWWTHLIDASKLNPRCDRALYRVSLADEIQSGAATKEYAKKLEHDLGEARYNQIFMLKSKKDREEWKGEGFLQFAQDRLYITTDRSTSMLTQLQKDRIKGDEGVTLTALDPTPIQLKYLEFKEQAIKQGKRKRFLLLKYRQGGFTTLEQGENYYTVATRPRSKVVTLAHTDESTTRIFEIARNFHTHDPYAPELANQGNKRELKFKDLRSTFFIGTAGGSGVGRGFTLQRVHGSEISSWARGRDRIMKVQEIIGGILPGAKNGEVVLETTPRGTEWFYHTYMEAKRGENDWTNIFLPWYVDPMNRMAHGTFNPEEIRDTITQEEQDLMLRVGPLDEAQLAFRRFQKRELKTLFAQEYPEDDESCFLTSGTLYFDASITMSRIAYWDKNYQGNRRTKRTGGVNIEIYEPPIPGVKYCIGVDTSEGLGGETDPNGLGVMRVDNGHQVASVHGYARIPDQAKWVWEMHLKYNKAMVGVERENHGHAVLALLVNQYHMRGGEKDGYQKGDLFYFKGDRPGWDTTSVTRPQMLSDLAEAVEAREEGWRDRPFLSELLTFRLQDDGQFRADDGMHDDRVMKWAICEQMRKVKRMRPNISFVELNPPK